MINDPLPPDFWTLEEQELLAVLLPLLEEMARDGIAISLDELAGYSITADPADASARTSAWARAYAGELIRKINPTTRAAVGAAVANWFETPGATMGDLTNSLQRILGSNEYRAALIATTETTRAYAEGSDLARQEAGLPATAYNPPAHPGCRCWPSPAMLANGDWVVTWQTNRDEVVCKQPLMTPWGEVAGCRGLHGHVISEGAYLGMTLDEAEARAAG
jgi:hypothetical protein